MKKVTVIRTKAVPGRLGARKDLEEAIQQDRAEAFASMGRSPAAAVGDANLAERVGALEESVNQLGEYVAEQVAPAEDASARVSESALWEGTKKGIELGALGLGMGAAGPLGGLAATMLAAGGLESIKSATPDVTPLIKQLIGGESDYLGKEQTGTDLSGAAKSRDQ